VIHYGTLHHGTIIFQKAVARRTPRPRTISHDLRLQHASVLLAAGESNATLDSDVEAERSGDVWTAADDDELAR
jgi:hypothetical protein